MAETIGSLVDKISIAELKIYHTAEKMNDPFASGELKSLCRDRLGVLEAQTRDLADELSGLLAAFRVGEWKPKIYRQFKMYNDPRFQKK